jgi:TRAP-type uncharacterized transport system fused permease subunit
MVAKGLYLVPVLFAYSPLISGSWPERVEVFVWACLGLYALAGLLQWYLERPLGPLQALVLLASSSLLMWAPFPFYLHLLGAALLVGIVIYQRRQPQPGSPGAGSAVTRSEPRSAASDERASK